MNATPLHLFTQLGLLMTRLVEKIKPKEHVTVQVERPVNPIPDDDIEGMGDVLMMHMASLYNDDMMLTDESLPVHDENEYRTIQFQRNRHTIKVAMDGYIAKNGKLPTTTTLARITGLSRPTIDAHLKAGAINLHFRQELSKLQLLSSDLLVKLYQMGLNGDAKAIKALIDITYTGQKLNIGAGTQNFIQINNLRVQNNNFEKLSSKAKVKIEKIIRSDLKLKG